MSSPLDFMAAKPMLHSFGIDSSPTSGPMTQLHPQSPASASGFLPPQRTPSLSRTEGLSPTAASALSVVYDDKFSSSGTAASRRPPRKSTLTQQQKNQKRQRATQDQLTTLETEFNKNPTPTAIVREQIAQDINMTERSVQIWFQNRRAKTKCLARKGFGEGADVSAETMRQYLAQQSLDGKPFSPDLLQHSDANERLSLDDSASNSKTIIQHLSCKSLSIGTWHRAGQNAMDLVIFYAPDDASMTYYINNDGAGYKIEYPFSSIRNISLEAGLLPDKFANALGPQQLQGIRVELTRPPNFFMESATSNGFHQCGDFTEDQQASLNMVHHLGGDANVIGDQLMKLTSLNSYQKRHAMHDRSFISMPSGPSAYPGPPRPSSQPNNLVHPVFGYHDDHNFVIPPPPKGHKRQRSRSVPVAIDFSSAPPMPSFHLQKPSVNMIDTDSIFAPIPQHANNSFTNALRIDTTPAFQSQQVQPMSAIGNQSGAASDFATSPDYFPVHQAEPASASVYHPSPLHMPFLSPMAESAPQDMQHCMSPLSVYSQGDPIIADGSPLLGGDFRRSASVDFLSLNQEQHSVLSDDGLLLSEMYSKQNLNNVHERSPNPALDDSEVKFPLPEDSAVDGLDLQSIVGFGSLQNDASGLDFDKQPG